MSNDAAVRPNKPPNAPSPKILHAPKPPPIAAVNIEDVKKSKLMFATGKGSVPSSEFAAEPELKLNGVVGFNTLPYQFVRRCQNNG